MGIHEIATLKITRRPPCRWVFLFVVVFQLCLVVLFSVPRLRHSGAFFDVGHPEDAGLWGFQHVVRLVPMTTSKMWYNAINMSTTTSPLAATGSSAAMQLASCSPREDVFFLKVHKSGSTTIQRVLLARAYRLNLTTMMQTKGWFLGWPKRFTVGGHKYKNNMIHRGQDPDIKFHITAHHLRYDHDELARVLPPRTVYIGTVRSVVHQFESAFRYYNLGRPYPYFNRSYVDFVSGLQDYPAMAKHVKLPFMVPLRNAMLFDYGVVPGGSRLDQIFHPDHTNYTYLLSSIERLLEEFDLILIADYMDESLVLLADLLCWPLDQVVTTSHTVMKSSGSSPYRLDDSLEQVVLAWNRADDLFYQMALAIFLQKRKRYGKARMARDVARLRNIRENMIAQCAKKTELSPETQEDCEMMRVWEPYFTYILKARLWPSDIEQFSWDQEYFCSKPAARATPLLMQKYCPPDMQGRERAPSPPFIPAAPAATARAKHAAVRSRPSRKANPVRR